ncbi:hypothetical protein [Salinivibrio sharmensis]|uniref:Tyr recombinase domain-containing protein n=1 Tax=Salinivibrio sharmensis TaxID=390883 RepID=A0ABX3K9P7_9GAMM|nr:hypothetical protein [Salinivibrio sharmensis]OOE85641.1 hypothetical protein BZG74_13775 [Salinivibrio sharmensis]
MGTAVTPHRVALYKLELSNVTMVGVDEIASRLGHRYVTMFLSLQRKQKPVIFAVPGCGKDSIKDEDHTPNQVSAFEDLIAAQSATADAWAIKETLSWNQKASTHREGDGGFMSAPALQSASET